jgi:hypothetical protein
MNDVEPNDNDATMPDGIPGQSPGDQTRELNKIDANHKFMKIEK